MPFNFSLDICDAGNMKSAAAMHVTFFIFCEASHDVFTYLQLSTERGQDKTKFQRL